jgi:hypothetical protein
MLGSLGAQLGRDKIKHRSIVKLIIVQLGKKSLIAPQQFDRPALNWVIFRIFPAIYRWQAPNDCNNVIIVLFDTHPI